MKILNVLIVCLFIAFVSCISFQEDIEGIEFLPNFLPANVSGRKYCPTEDIWKWKSVVRSQSFKFGQPFACATQGNCDNYAERNKWTNKAFEIPLQVQVVCCTSTNCNGITQARVNDQVRQINEDFKNTGFVFTVAQTRFLVNSTYCELPAYSSSSNAWYNNLLAAKRAFAVTPTQYLNVFITAQKAGTQGTLLGIGTFPWDSDSTLATGGLWVNAAYVKYGDKTASHEIGHNVGLWHTFHGDSEVACTNGCYEVVHQGTSNTDVANTVGDFCADTPAQPMNYNCQYPTGSDCKGNKYTLYGNNPVLINNIMAYTPDSCMQSFTAQQSMRAHCWVCAKLKGYDHKGNHCK